MNREIKFTEENFEKLKTGDRDSFDLLYQEYYLVLYRTALLILGNKEDAEDVLQDTFVSIYKNAKTLSDFEKLSPWIFSILKNTSYTRYKKRKREFPDEFIPMSLSLIRLKIVPPILEKMTLQKGLRSKMP